MPAHDRLSRVFFENEQSPMLLPHHLFMLAAAEAGKEAALLTLSGMDVPKPEKEIDTEFNSNSLPVKSPDACLSDNSFEGNASSDQSSEEDEQKESRMIIHMTCSVKTLEDGKGQSLSLLLRLEDEMNRQLKCTIGEGETPTDLANELVGYGLINELDRDKVADKIQESLKCPA